MLLDGRNPRDQFLVGHVTVLLDGKDRTHRCVAADDTAGWILVYREDEHGEILVNYEKSEALTRKEYGSVRIILKSGVIPQVIGLAIEVCKNRYKNLLR